MTDKIVIYHDPCTDGFAAAWVCWLQFGRDAEYFPTNYKTPPPDVTGKEVYIVDFSYPRAILLDMYDKAETLVVLDHHKTAEEDLRNLPFCVFDMERSGAGITWDYFHTEPSFGVQDKRPWIIDYVEDRDLWNWKLDNSKEVSAAIRSWPMDFHYWFGQKAYLKSFDIAITEGTAILRAQDQRVAAQCKQAAMLELDGHTIPIINAVGDTSDVLNALIKMHNVTHAVAWWRNNKGQYTYSLRSNGVFDVSKLAKKYGGGGHRAAAGFMLENLIV